MACIQHRLNELMRQQAASLQHATGLGRLSGLGAGVLGGGQLAQNQREYNYRLSQQGEQAALNLNQYVTANRELTIKEELQAETDEWLKDICI